jgi:hypothetical protein
MAGVGQQSCQISFNLNNSLTEQHDGDLKLACRVSPYRRGQHTRIIPQNIDSPVPPNKFANLVLNAHQTSQIQVQEKHIAL